MTGPNIDQPDYQIGVSSGQVLIAEVTDNTTASSVGIPPNAETIVMYAKWSTVFEYPTVTGNTSGIQYKVIQDNDIGEDTLWAAYYVDVTSVIDEEISIVWPTAPQGVWWVYADAAAHISIDPTRLSDPYGRSSTVPGIPLNTPAGHPVQEATYTSGIATGTTQILGSPGAGQRYRIFSVQVGFYSSGTVIGVGDASNSVAFMVGAGPGTATTDLPEQGIIVNEGAAVNLTIYNGSGDVIWTICYSIETV